MGRNASNLGTSNPEIPHLWTVLALAKYLLSQTDILKGKSKLFPGSNQYERFVSIFHKVIKYQIEEVRVLGVKEGSLGSHLCRKCAMKLVSPGYTVLLPMESICLWACWSMGLVKYNYIHLWKCRRSVCGYIYKTLHVRFPSTITILLASNTTHIGFNYQPNDPNWDPSKVELIFWEDPLPMIYFDKNLNLCVYEGFFNTRSCNIFLETTWWSVLKTRW